MAEPSRLRFLLSRYDRRSLVALAGMLVLYAVVAILWWDLLRLNRAVVDGLLLGIWVAMTALLCWDVRPGRDVLLVLVALAGGAIIETGGTRLEVWHYFTRERPPMWILPAWPVAALATERIAWALDHMLGDRRAPWKPLYWIGLAAFGFSFMMFLGPFLDEPLPFLGLAVMLIIAVTGRPWRRDVVLFVAGSLLGIFLEYWGTSRHCWTYHTGQIPPPVAVLAHGFASIGFARGVDWAQWLLSRFVPDLRIAGRPFRD